MQVCLMIEGQEGVTWEQWVSLALACEEHGFDALFRSDHYLSFSHPSEWGNLDAWATLSALAALTERIHLGTLVSPVGYRHPSNVAKMVITVDHVSDGRAELGLGTGWHEGEHRAYGFPFPAVGDRMDMLGEQVEIVHRLWDRQEVTFEGAHYRLEGVHSLPKAVAKPHPNLILGGGAGPRSAALAARWADEYNMNFVSPAEFAAKQEGLSVACETRDRNPGELRRSVMSTVLVGENRKELEERGSRLMERRGQSGDVSLFLESLGENRIWGTPDIVLEKLEAYAKAGARRVMMQHLVHEDLESLALIGESIIPDATDF
jgi:F420-dependent oxidoreductase-like protein